MSKIKSFSVGNGDMFYIRHGSDNFTVIDCSLSDDNRERIVGELKRVSRDKGIKRFISTHPDQDHINGLAYVFEQLPIPNFYCVKNNATKQPETNDFKRYRQLLVSPKAFHISKGCNRKWMNVGDDERDSAGINILWPDTTDQHFKSALEQAANGGSPNNISPIIRYSLNRGVTALWMGDLETDFMEAITERVTLPKAEILFAPHHGRKSGRVPNRWLEAMNPKIIVVGEAPSEHLEYYSGYNTITQNTAGDITFQCETGWVHVYVTSPGYSVDFLRKRDRAASTSDGRYLGSLPV